MARKEAGKTQQEVADYLGIKRSTYANWEKNIVPGVDDLKKIANFLDTKLEVLIENKEYQDIEAISTVNEVVEPYINKRRHLKNTDGAGVPVYGGITTLGNISVYDDDNMKHEVIAKLPAHMFPGCDYAEKAKGDSMYPLIINQAWVIGKKTQADGISWGEKYVIKTKSGIDTTKFVHPGKTKNSIILKAYNKSIPDQEIKLEEIVFVCRVHWIINPT